MRPLRDTAWVPDKLRSLLVAGALVRIRLNEECPRKYLDHGTAEYLDSMGGKIIGVRKDESDHPYIVMVEGHPQYFAAVELEPLEEQP